jgi:Tfp pilus assembly protein FimV
MTATITVPSSRSRPARARSHRPRPVSPRTYARRRAVVGGVSATLAALTLIAGYDVWVGVGSGAATAAVSQPAGGGSVVARPGDTLWSIAEAHRGDVAVRRYVDALIDLNDGPSIQAGQRVTLP